MDRTVPHVFFYGLFHRRTGYGAAGDAYLRAMQQAGIDVTPVPLEGHTADVLAGRIKEGIGKDLRGTSWHIWHTEPSVVRQLDRRYDRLIVLTTWEADALSPKCAEALHRAVEVWVPCHYNLENFRRQLSVPVFRLPHPVRESVAPRFDREEFDREMGLPQNACVFATIGTWQYRKNLGGVVEAFLRAFPNEPNAILMIKTAFWFSPEETAKIDVLSAIAKLKPKDPFEAAARIRIYPNRWPEECLASFMQRADCYVSLHRGEGWCYPLFEAACSGIPVISTAYSGPMDYLRPEHHGLVDYTLAPTSQDGQSTRFCFDSSAQWAEPSVEHCAQLMRSVYENREKARERAAGAVAHLREEFTPENIGQMARLRLAELAAKAETAASREFDPMISVAAGYIPAAAAFTTPCTA